MIHLLFISRYSYRATKFWSIEFLSKRAVVKTTRRFQSFVDASVTDRQIELYWVITSYYRGL